MHTERRSEAKRIDVSRPVEFLDREGGEITTGFTRNLCQEGLRARVDDLSSQQSATILVRLFLEDGRDPVVKPARIVWCARDLYGEGAEVGLRLVDSLDEPEPPPAPAEAAPERGGGFEPAVLSEGQRVQVNAGGVILAATVTAIEAPDAGGCLRVTMKVVDGAEAESEEFDPEQWKARPIRDAVSEVRRYAGPVARCLALAFGFAWSVLAPLAVRVFHLIPAGPRARITGFFAALGRHRAVRIARGLPVAWAGAAKRAVLRVRERYLLWRSSRLPARAGD
jgi:hypothetical protein